MFEVSSNRSIKPYAVALGLLSLIMLIVTSWILYNVRHEQTILTQLIKHLAGSDLKVADELSSDLGLQRSLIFLLILNDGYVVIAF